MSEYFRLRPEELSGVLEGAGRSLFLVDFDETLWLRNSTEEFLSQARPAFVAATLLRMLDLARPWRVLFGRRRGQHFKDWMRVSAILVLMPWSYLGWRRIARRIGAQFANAPLEDLILAHRAERVVIVSNGFRILIAPLASGLRVREAELIAAPITHGGFWRAKGKKRAAEERLSGPALDSAVFVTDHEDDAELLGRVGTGVLCVWPEARYERAFARDSGEGV
ncbi:haloacid dehalogenase-like hydrolase [Ostreiculturibacter nitratireducens]|uniref:haloacid dehalogenase-like hydrolase n=1 Tax=Ostreiculturibacter nitratireducens TaxID=3075226 RepID=UPI0031B5E78F